MSEVTIDVVDELEAPALPESEAGTAKPYSSAAGLALSAVAAAALAVCGGGVVVVVVVRIAPALQQRPYLAAR